MKSSSGDSPDRAPSADPSASRVPAPAPGPAPQFGNAFPTQPGPAPTEHAGPARQDRKPTPTPPPSGTKPHVHCSWMNQVELWFSILQRKRLVASNVADLNALDERVLAFIAEWNATAHPFDWTPQSFDEILAKVDAELRGVRLRPCPA